MVRFKNRFLVVELIWGEGARAPAELSSKALDKALRESLSRNFGIIGVARTNWSLQVKHCDPAASIAVIRTDREEHETVWAALSFIRELLGHDVVCRVLHVSAMPRSCIRAAVPAVRARVDAARAGLGTRAAREALDAAAALQQTALLALVQ
ncbi:hypothetical protein T484DRAFT_1964905 [Baffinella frigidus]|nr:hypothetical protein T484DRAFT_1964905 [Cryptophyta sp. CCMP2293]